MSLNEKPSPAIPPTSAVMSSTPAPNYAEMQQVNAAGAHSPVQQPGGAAVAYQGGYPDQNQQQQQQQQQQQYYNQQQPGQQQQRDFQGQQQQQPHPQGQGQQQFSGQQQPQFNPNFNPNAVDMSDGARYQQMMMAQCASGNHSYDTRYGIVGILVAVICCPCGLLALLVDKKKICTRCGHTVS